MTCLQVLGQDIYEGAQVSAFPTPPVIRLQVVPLPQTSLLTREYCVLSHAEKVAIYVTGEKAQVQREQVTG